MRTRQCRLLFGRTRHVQSPYPESDIFTKSVGTRQCRLLFGRTRHVQSPLLPDTAMPFPYPESDIFYQICRDTALPSPLRALLSFVMINYQNNWLKKLNSWFLGHATTNQKPGFSDNLAFSPTNFAKNPVSRPRNHKSEISSPSGFPCKGAISL